LQENVPRRRNEYALACHLEGGIDRREHSMMTRQFIRPTSSLGAVCRSTRAAANDCGHGFAIMLVLACVACSGTTGSSNQVVSTTSDVPILQTLPEIRNFGVRGVPFIDKDNKRLWSLAYTGKLDDGYYDGIQYSDDYGGTWVDFVQHLPPDLRPWMFSLFVDGNRNVYYTIINGVVRVDAVTREPKQVITFLVRKPGDPPGQVLKPPYPWSAWAYMNIWGMTEDANGNLYCPEYLAWDTGCTDNTTCCDQSGAGPCNDLGALEGQYIFKSTNQGRDWTVKDWLIDVVGTTVGCGAKGAPANFRHVHNLKYNPYDRNIYLSAGDNYRAAFVSRDGLETPPTLLDESDGPTGLTFTWPNVYWGHDCPSTTIAYYNDDLRTWVADAFTPPAPYTDETYETIAASDTEIWFTEPDFTTPTNYSGLNRIDLTASGWSFTNVLSGVGAYSGVDENKRPIDASPQDYYYAASHNRHGMIPSEFPFVFVQHVNTKTLNYYPNEIIRVRRNPAFDGSGKILLSNIVSTTIQFGLY
jgi:hypothetical protein